NSQWNSAGSLWKWSGRYVSAQGRRPRWPASIACLTALRSVDDAGASEGGCGRVECAFRGRSLVVLMPVDLRGFALEELQLVGGDGRDGHGGLRGGFVDGCGVEGAGDVGAGDVLPEFAEGLAFLVTQVGEVASVLRPSLDGAGWDAGLPG